MGAGWPPLSCLRVILQQKAVLPGHPQVQVGSPALACGKLCTRRLLFSKSA